MQMQLFLDKAASEKNRDKGMQQAVDHAEEVTKNWAQQAYSFLVNYAYKNEHFMAEEVRQAAAGIVPEPPNLRAWGSVIARAAKKDVIVQDGYKKVSNPKANRTPAAVWKSKVF